MTIVEFLTARLDAYEADAQLMPVEPDGYGTHMNCIDRAEALADIAAKREIIKWCGERDQIWVGTIASNPELRDPKDYVPGGLKNPADSMVLRYLASVYSDHPDYTEGWKP